MDDSINPSVYSRYLPVLDGLRGCAILFVVAFHLAPSFPADSAMDDMLFNAARFGWIGVDLFFVLSGFLITGILYDNRSRANLLRTFFARRALRILPLFYCFLLLYSLVIPAFYPDAFVRDFYGTLPWHAAYLTNLKLAAIGSWPASFLDAVHIWSLAVEEQFYLVWPLVLLLVARFSSQPRRHLIVVSLLLLCVGPAFRILALDTNPIAAYVLLPARMDAIFAGAIVALWLRGHPGKSQALRYCRATIIVFGGASLVMAFASGSMYSYLSPLQQSAGYTTWAILFAALLTHLVIAPPKIVSHILSSASMIGLGKISYGLYLLHYPVIKILERTVLDSIGFFPFAILAVVLSIALAMLSWFLLEKPILKLKKHFNYGQSDSLLSKSPLPSHG